MHLVSKVMHMNSCGLYLKNYKLCYNFNKNLQCLICTCYKLFKLNVHSLSNKHMKINYANYTYRSTKGTN